MTSEEFLLSTKLYLPPGRSRLVARPRLMALLNEGLTRPLTLISAPAGFGKTTLLSEWHASEAGKTFPMAWLSLDGDDNNLSRFLAYLTATAGTLQTGIGETALAALQSQQPPPPEVLLTSLINDLNAFHAPFALVLDDYHVITSLGVHKAIHFLLDHLPPQMHLILLTRADPPLPLARLRARNQLTEIRAPELRFLPEEAAQFLNEMMELELSAEDIVALENRTEGWIAGLLLTALSLRQQNDKHAFVAAFTGNDRYIMDYLLEEVLLRQPPEVQAFLLKTSILERLCSPLCAAITGEPESQTMLASLEEANLFLEPLDNQRYWYRYHNLFSDLLRRRLCLAMELPELISLYRRACAWLEGEGFISEAISQALAAPDFEQAADLLERHILTVFYRGETMLVHSWLKALPEAVIRQRPLLCAMYANTIAHAGGFQSAALLQTSHWLEVANQALRGQGAERNESGKLHQPADHLTQSFIATTRAYLALWRGDPPRTVIELARQALADLPPTDKEPLDLNFLRLRSGLSNNIGFSYLMLGDEEAAIQAYAEAQRIGKSCGDLLNMYSAISRQVFILRRHGRLPEAATLCQKAMNATETGTKPERSIPYLGVIYLALGQILLEWNDLAAAKNALTKSLELSRLMAETDAQLESSISLTHIKLAEGDVQSALDLLDQIDLVSEKAKILIPAWRARIHIAQSNQHPEALNKALQWAEGKVLRECDPFWPAIEPLTLARVLIAQCRSASHSATAHSPDLNLLLQFLDLQIQTAEKGNWVERMIELRVLQALTWHMQKHLLEALDSLHNALDLAEPGGYMRLFLDEGLPIRRLLSKIKVDNDRINRYIGKLLVATGETGPVSRLIPDQQPLIEPLSMRELEVLRLLVLGSSNAEIAQKLVITLNTTKKHVTHIFEKLGATNRAEAAQRAMDLGLVPPSSHPK